MKLAGALLLLNSSRAQEALFDDLLENHLEESSGDGTDPPSTTGTSTTGSTTTQTTTTLEATSVPITDDPPTTTTGGGGDPLTTTTNAPATTTTTSSWISDIEQISMVIYAQFITRLPGSRRKRRNNQDENVREQEMRDYLESFLADYAPSDSAMDYDCSVDSVKQLGIFSANFRVKYTCNVVIAEGSDLAAFENEEELFAAALENVPTGNDEAKITAWAETTATYSYTNAGSCDADNNGCAYDCFEGECVCPVCWEVAQDGKSCLPEDGRFSIQCSSDKMLVSIDSCVVPHAGAVYIGEDECTGEIDGNIYHLTSPLDGCGTSLSKSDDGELVFTNQLIGAGRKNSFIRLGPETQLDLSCKYDSVYDNITAVTTIDSNNFTGGGDGEGKLKFHITSYTDETFAEEVGEDHTTKLGGNIYFGVKIDKPIEGVEFAISDCKVVDEQLGLEHAILSDFCPDSFVNMAARSSFVDNNEVFMSYKSFLFLTSEEEISELKLVCQAVACASDDLSSECQATSCVVNRRGRLFRRSISSSPESSKIYTLSMNLKHRNQK